MNKITTRRCHERGHPELEVDYDPEKLLALDAERFAELLESMVHAGSRFEIGQSLQIGWSLAVLPAWVLVISVYILMDNFAGVRSTT